MFKRLKKLLVGALALALSSCATVASRPTPTSLSEPTVTITQGADEFALHDVSYVFQPGGSSAGSPSNGSGGGYGTGGSSSGTPNAGIACSGDLSQTWPNCWVIGLHFGTTAIPLSSTPPTSGQLLGYNGTSIVGVNAGSGSGTVTSVALSAPSIFSVSGSPVTTSGTLTLALATESANEIFAGPTSGSAAAPTFRALVGADLPDPSASSLGGVESLTSVSHEWINSIGTNGVPTQTQPSASDISGLGALATLGVGTSLASSGGNLNLSMAGGSCATHNFGISLSATGTFACAQPAFTDISGTLAASQLPDPTTSALGGVEASTATSHEWINQINTLGVPQLSQPACGDLSNGAPSCSTDTTNASNISSGTLASARLPGGLSNTWKSQTPSTAGQYWSWNTSNSDFELTAAPSGSGTVTSVAMTVPSQFSISGSPITSSGTLALTYTASSCSSNQFGTEILSTGALNCAQPSFSNLSGSVAASQMPALTGDTTSSAGSVATTTVALHPTLNSYSSNHTVASTETYDACSGSTTLTLPSATGTGKVFVFKKTDSSNTCTISRAGSDTIDGATSVTLTVQYQSVAIIDEASATWHVVAGEYPIVCGSNTWLSTIPTTGAPSCTQPAFSNISGTVAASQLPDPTSSTLGGVESATQPSNEFMSGISTAGVPQFAQPAFSNLSGEASNSQLDGTKTGIGFDFIGTPTASMIEAYTAVNTLVIPTNFGTPNSVVTCGTDPSESDAYTVKVNGSSVGTITISTSCGVTLGTATQTTISSGQRVEIDAPATVSGKDIAITLGVTRDD